MTQVQIAGALFAVAVGFALWRTAAFFYAVGRRRGGHDAAGRTAELSALVEEQAGQIRALSAQALEEQRKRVQTVECIGIIEKERNTWKEMYYNAGLGHSAAQTMLMREIERLSRLCVSAGVKKGTISEGVKRVVAEYEEKVGGPVRSEMRGGISSGSPVEKPVAGV